MDDFESKFGHEDVKKAVSDFFLHCEIAKAFGIPEIARVELKWSRPAMHYAGYRLDLKTLYWLPRWFPEWSQ